MRAATVGERAPLSAEKLDRRVSQLAEFAQTHPGLLPANCRSPEFLARLRDDVPRVAVYEQAIAHQLADDSDYVALCHWNANIDNAWFWRDSGGALQCGLMDWGCVGQMNLGMALWGAMSGAETDMGHPSRRSAATVRRGIRALRRSASRNWPVASAHAALRGRHGVAWLLDVPALIRKRFDTVPGTRKDPRIRDDEGVRAPLQMLSNLLSAWERHRVGDLLDDVLP